MSERTIDKWVRFIAGPRNHAAESLEQAGLDPTILVDVTTMETLAAQLTGSYRTLVFDAHGFSDRPEAARWRSEREVITIADLPQLTCRTLILSGCWQWNHLEVWQKKAPGALVVAAEGKVTEPRGSQFVSKLLALGNQLDRDNVERAASKLRTAARWQVSGGDE